MANYLLIKDGFVANRVEIDPSKLTETYIKNDRGERIPTMVVNGETVVSTTMYVCPEGYALIQSDDGSPGEAYPLVRPDPEQPPA